MGRPWRRDVAVAREGGVVACGVDACRQRFAFGQSGALSFKRICSAINRGFSNACRPDIGPERLPSRNVGVARGSVSLVS